MNIFRHSKWITFFRHFSFTHVRIATSIDHIKYYISIVPDWADLWAKWFCSVEQKSTVPVIVDGKRRCSIDSNKKKTFDMLVWIDFNLYYAWTRTWFTTSGRFDLFDIGASLCIIHSSRKSYSSNTRIGQILFTKYHGNYSKRLYFIRVVILTVHS